MHTQEHEDVTRGIYYPFSILVREEGGKDDAAAVVAANNYSKKRAAQLIRLEHQEEGKAFVCEASSVGSVVLSSRAD